MRKLSRREVIKLGAGVTTGAALGSAGMSFATSAAAAEMPFKPEPGARLRLLRWKRFVQGDEDLFEKNIAKFTKLTGVPVRVDHESWEDVRPKAAVAANIGSGPDIIIAWYDDPHQYPDKLIDMTDVAEDLGKRYGGWYPAARTYGTRNGRWISIPWGAAGNAMVYRGSWLKEAGFERFPEDTAGLLKLCRALKKNGHPPGFALGNAGGDGNVWTHWLLWSHGGKLVDENNQPAVVSPETEASLEFARQLYETFIPGTTSWLDANNNKAFLAGKIGLTANGISVYYAAKKGKLPIASDIQHANLPVGPVGRPMELHLLTQMMGMGYSKYPKAVKSLIHFLMSKEQYLPWQQASIGYITQPLKAYASNPVWTEDPKHTPYRDCVARMVSNGYAGALGYASAQVMADYVVVNMVAEAASGTLTPKEAMKRAEKRVARYYRI